MKNRLEYRTPEMSEKIILLRNQIHQDEVKLLREYKPCSAQYRKYIASRLSKLNPKLFKELLMDYVYDPNVFVNGSCVLDALIQHNGPIAYQDQLKEYFLNVMQIGTTSSNNYAMATSLGAASNMFILKAPRPYVESDLTHELFVGLFGTNRLRREIPNFAYIFGGFFCSGPMIDPNTKQVENFCSYNLPQVQYIIYENVNPNTPLDEYVRTCTDTQFVEKYLQILLSLNYANQTIGFTHYDLHSKNVILRKYPEKDSFILKFKTSTEILYLTTDYIATIIDFDVSHIIYSGKNFGNSSFRIEFNVLPQESFPLYDAYKLLGFCMHTMLESGNFTAFNEASKILKYFTDENPEEVVLNQIDIGRFMLPDFNELINKGLEELINHIRRVCFCPFLNDTPDGPVMHCDDEIYTCLTDLDFRRGTRLIGKPKPKDVLQYYDFFTNHKEDINYSKIFNDFKANYNRLIATGVSKLRSFRDDIKFLLSTTKIIRIDESIFTEDGIRNYQQFLSDVARILFIRDRFFFHHIVIEELMDMMNDLENKGNLNFEFSTFKDSLGKTLKDILEIVNLDNKILDDWLENRPVITELIRQNPEFEWLATGRKSFTFSDRLIE